METKKTKGICIEIKLPKGIQAQLDRGLLMMKGTKGETKRSFLDKNIEIMHKGDVITLNASKFSQRNKKLIKSSAAHIKNMIRGCSEGHKYALKICSGHFPMNVSVNNSQFIVKNFLGEKVPRTLDLKPGASVKVEGDLVVVESTSKEIAGQVSADIETLTKRTGYDGRIFQDGLWIVTKDNKELK
ncbi:MAG TPA: 50S ribosomal protein L6 [Candidatus Dadabacteria bacterium]|nr:50S ribosomal protein L6 [Candidatus Dadabacteria bacterium]